MADATKPNIVVIMADDIGWFNIGAYHQGMMAGRTPNLDKVAAEGMRFTDYYAEASCTAVARSSLPDSYRSGPGLRRSAKPARRSACRPKLRPSRPHCGRKDMRPVSSARIIWATSMSSCHGSRFRRVFRLPISSRRDGGSVAQELPARADRQNRPAQHDSQLGDEYGRCDGAAPLGQGRQAEDRRRRHAVPRANGNGRRRDSRPRAQVHRRRESRRQAVLLVAQSDAHARKDASFRQVQRLRPGKRLVDSRGRWRNSTTSSAPS